MAESFANWDLELLQHCLMELTQEVTTLIPKQAPTIVQGDCRGLANPSYSKHRTNGPDS